MTKIYTFCERDGQSPFLSLFHKLDRKLQQKILKGLRCMVLYPSYRTQPHVKHFTIERYSGLYEYGYKIHLEAIPIPAAEESKEDEYGHA